MLIYELGSEGRGARAQYRSQEYKGEIPETYLRKSPPGLPAVSELQVVRHYTNLSKKNFSIDGQFYPLGSCTMKYNPRVTMDASLFDATLDHLERTTVRKKLGGKLMDEIKALAFEDKTPEEVEAAENINARIILTYDSRKKGMVLGRQGVEDLAARMLTDEDEGFAIITAGGEKIKGSDISLRKTVSLPKHGKSVFCSDAWRELEAYYYELRDGGLLEQ